MVGGAAAVLSSVTDNQISWPFFHHRFTKNLWYHFLFFFFLAKSIMHVFGFRFSKNRKHQGYITSWWCTPKFLRKNACTNCISTTVTSRKSFLKLAQIFTPCFDDDTLSTWCKSFCENSAFSFLQISLNQICFIFIFCPCIQLHAWFLYTRVWHIFKLCWYWHVWWHLLLSPHWHGSNLVFSDPKWQFFRLSTWCTCISPLGKFQDWS